MMDWTKLDFLPRDLLKDLALYVPVLGSVLALAWETGSFIPIGSAAFGLFSFSEHVLFALEAFPYVLSVIIGVTTAGAVVAVISKRSSAEATPSKFSKPWMAKAIAVSLYVASGIGISRLGLYWHRGTVLVFGIAGIAAGIGFFSPSRIFVPKIVVPAGLVFAVVLTIAFGSDVTRFLLNNTEAADFNVDGVVRKAVLVRSGERGLLTYEPSTQSFHFEKWGSVKSIAWERRSVLSGAGVR
jgi:hypothetical protein